MKIYVDSDYKCHVSNPAGTMTNLETDFFDGKCDAYIEGHRYVPAGESWTREDGTVFTGEMIAPWRDCNELDNAQLDYEREQLADALVALAILGVSSDE